MKSLEHYPPRSFLIALTLLGLVATIVFRLAFSYSERQMQAAGGYGIVDYELAFTPGRVDTILTAWGEEGQTAALQSLLIDFGFMPAYALLFGGITLLIARGSRERLAEIGLWLVPAMFGAALLDVLENVMLLRLLGTQGQVAALPGWVAGVAASLKFLLLALAVLYWLAAGLAKIRFRRIR